MKTIEKRFLILTILLGLACGGCVGYVGDGRGYGHGWYHDGGWADGGRGYVGVGVYPMRR